MSLTVIRIEARVDSFLIAKLFGGLFLDETGDFYVVPIIFPGESTKVLVIKEQWVKSLASCP